MSTKITTSNELIIQALYLINEYSPNELPSADEITQGLILLNTKLDEMSGNEIFIPYTKSIDFDLIANQADYVFSRDLGADVASDKITEIIDAVIHYGNVDIPLEEIQHNQAFQLVRYPQAATRPTQIFLQNAETSSTVKFIYTPDTNYSVTLRCKFVLSNLDLQETITNVPPNYIRFLLFALARDLSLIYENSAWGDRHESEYMKLYENLTSSTDKDWSINPSLVLSKRAVGWNKGSIITG